MSTRLVLVLVLLLQHVLVNTVAASVHMAAENHSTRETPHVHSLGTLLDMLQPIAVDHHNDESFADHQQHSGSDHNCHDSLDEVHVHVICPLAHSLEMPQLPLFNQQPAAIYQSYQGLTYKPLLPPPNS